jgi:hypothetical protein
MIRAYLRLVLVLFVAQLGYYNRRDLQPGFSSTG